MTLNLPTYTPIANKFVSVSGSTTTITFSNIPQKYKHLMVTLNSFTTNSTAGNTTNLFYINNYFQGANPGVKSIPEPNYPTNTTNIAYYSNSSGLLSLSAPDLNYPMTSFFCFPNYSNSNYNKIFLLDQLGGNLSSQSKTTVSAPLFAGVYTLLNTAAITSLTFSGNPYFDAGTEIALFGVI